MDTVSASLVVVVAVTGAAGRTYTGGAMGRAAGFARLAELSGANDGVERLLDAPQ
jgi:hypothetical protein